MLASSVLSLLAFIPISFASVSPEPLELSVRDTKIPSRLALAHAHRRRAAAKRTPSINESQALPDVEKRASTYSLAESWSGESFFDGWTFFDGSDPTHGTVNYLSKSDATSAKLAYVSDGVAYMRVDNTTNLSSGTGRKSVRIASSKRFQGGLFIADVAHIPTGKATWPAFWTVGSDWPNHGEIDIIEGVNTATNNQMTVHSASGCKLDLDTAPSGFKVPNSIASVTGSTCASSSGSNAGCGFVDQDDASFGEPLNSAGGGVFAMEWTDSGVRIWRFPRSDIPSDISSSPNPSEWSSKYLRAAWASNSCDSTKFFQSHTVTFDTTLCGDWAGAAFSGGKSACNTFVKTGSNFDEAYWAVNSVSVWQT